MKRSPRAVHFVLTIVAGLGLVATSSAILRSDQQAQAGRTGAHRCAPTLRPKRARTIRQTVEPSGRPRPHLQRDELRRMPRSADAGRRRPNGRRAGADRACDCRRYGRASLPAFPCKAERRCHSSCAAAAKHCTACAPAVRSRPARARPSRCCRAQRRSDRRGRGRYQWSCGGALWLEGQIRHAAPSGRGGSKRGAWPHDRVVPRGRSEGPASSTCGSLDERTRRDHPLRSVSHAASRSSRKRP